MKLFSARNTLLLSGKELLSLKSDTVMLVLMVFAFTVFIVVPARNALLETRNASVAVVDEDRSPLSQRLFDALLPPEFQPPAILPASAIDRAMDRNQYTFILRIPVEFQADLSAGRQPELQLLVDATAMSQAGNGAGYIERIVQQVIAEWLQQQQADAAVEASVRILYNPNLYGSWFLAVIQIINVVAMLAIVLTGAALIRERERGTIEHLLVLPLSPVDIALAKVLANSSAILVAMLASVVLVVRGLLDVPLQGSMPLFVTGTFLYLFGIAAIGIFLGTVARSMPQLGLLFLPVAMIINVLSGGITPMESMPTPIQYGMQLVPSTHFTRFATAVLFRGAELALVWRDLAAMALIGGGFFLFAIARFRAAMSAAG